MTTFCLTSKRASSYSMKDSRATVKSPAASPFCACPEYTTCILALIENSFSSFPYLESPVLLGLSPLSAPFVSLSLYVPASAATTYPFLRHRGQSSASGFIPPILQKGSFLVPPQRLETRSWKSQQFWRPFFPLLHVAGIPRPSHLPALGHSPS
jgi:hypothetical protein